MAYFASVMTSLEQQKRDPSVNVHAAKENFEKIIKSVL